MRTNPVNTRKEIKGPRARITTEKLPQGINQIRKKKPGRNTKTFQGRSKEPRHANLLTNEARCETRMPKNEEKLANLTNGKCGWKPKSNMEQKKNNPRKHKSTKKAGRHTWLRALPRPRNKRAQEQWNSVEKQKIGIEANLQSISWNPLLNKQWDSSGIGTTTNPGCGNRNIFQ